MLAARDQENRLFGHSIGGAGGKQALQPRTPGAKFPKTPSKMPGRTGGIENLQKGAKTGKAGPVTPLEPRTSRAPLGNKTTNAKAQTIQQQRHLLQKQQTGVKDLVREIEKSQQQQQQQQPPASARRARVISPRVNAFKLSVLSDEQTKVQGGEGEEEDIEHAPARVPARPYESDVFPNGALTFAAFKPQNRMRGYYNHYYNPVDENGISKREKEFATKQRKAFDKLDKQVLEDLDRLDWSIGDVPASKVLSAKPKQALSVKAQPPTLAARKAASALALSSKAGPSTALQSKTARPINARITAPTAASKPKSSSALLSVLPPPLRKQRVPTALPLRSKNPSHPVAETASRTTLGYNKGRSALSMVRGTGTTPGRPVASAPAAAARTPVRTPAQKQTVVEDDLFGGKEVKDEDEAKSPAFLSIFEADDEPASLGGASTFVNEELDDDFQMDVKF